MSIISDQPVFIALFQSAKYEFDKTEQYVNRTVQGAIDHAVELLSDWKESKVQIVEFNIAEGYSKDISEDAARLTNELIFDDGTLTYEQEEERLFIDPNAEHDLSKSQLGLGA